MSESEKNDEGINAPTGGVEDPSLPAREAATDLDSPSVTVIERTTGLRALGLKELWRYRELLYFLTWRDIKVRYKQTVIGVIWVVLQPLAMMALFTVFFGKLARVPSDGIPYPVFAYSALLPWQLFSRTLTESTVSLIADQRLITKVYFPRLLVPTAKSLGALVDFAISSVLLIGLLFIFDIDLSWRVLIVPLLLLILVATSLGVGYWLSAINLEFRDVKHAMAFLTQVWFFMTPVVYPTSLVPEQWRTLYSLNPMVGVIDGFRWAFLGTGSVNVMTIFFTACLGIGLFVSGIVWFRYRERTFIDLVG